MFWKIWVWVKEIERICKKGGDRILINPVSWPYHEAPIDCWRIYPEDVKALLEDTRLRIVETRFESLEVPGYKRYTPGVSAGHTPKRRLIYQFLHRSDWFDWLSNRALLRHHYDCSERVTSGSAVIRELTSVNPQKSRLKGCLVRPLLLTSSRFRPTGPVSLSKEFDQ